MTIEQLIAVKGKHFRRVYCNKVQRAGLEVYMYDDESVQLYWGKIEAWWPAKENAQRLPELTSTTWEASPYADNKETQDTKKLK